MGPTPTPNVAIYAFFSGKMDNFGNLTGVKDLTKSMSVRETTRLAKCAKLRR